MKQRFRYYPHTCEMVDSAIAVQFGTTVRDRRALRILRTIREIQQLKTVTGRARRVQRKLYWCGKALKLFSDGAFLRAQLQDSRADAI